MATRDPVLDELMRNGGTGRVEGGADLDIKPDALRGSSPGNQSQEARGEDIGECSA